MTRLSGHGSSGAMTRFWRLAVLTSAAAIGATARADAALYYWPSAEPSFWRSEPSYYAKRQKIHRHSATKRQEPVKDTGAKPQGPLIINVSIDKQRVRIYDDNGLFAEAPVSTGMRGHPTPMGVFSVIQKHRWHHSNIYSGAPMPYMQRITWSGVAMHAGVLPGYPASHGCIRMPEAFAIKMWNWTKMGARVIVTPGELTPSSFSHPLLAAFKVPPQPAASNAPEADAPVAVKADKGAPENKEAAAESKLELRATVGHADDIKAPIDPTPAAPLRDQTHTADASGDLVPAKAPVAMSDASASRAAPADESAASEAKGDGGNKASGESAEKPSEKASAGASETVIADAKLTETASTEKAESKSAEAPAATQPNKGALAAQPAADATTERKSAEGKLEAARPDSPRAEPKLEAADRSNKPAETPKPAAAPDARKDQTRLPDADKPVAAKPEPPKRTGQIAVFISRKDSKVYVRQNFEPLFSVPVTIAPSDRPLGTHVFTAEVDKNDPNALHWSVVSLPMSARAIQRDDGDERGSRRRRGRVAVASTVEAKPLPVPDSPAEALDRISVPGDAMARINEALTTGGSIVVSDQGINQGDTGEGTDFIVSLR